VFPPAYWMTTLVSVPQGKGTELCAHIPEATFDLSSGSLSADMARSVGLTQQPPRSGCRH
jgi:hypothetical protein